MAQVLPSCVSPQHTSRTTKPKCFQASAPFTVSQRAFLARGNKRVCQQAPSISNAACRSASIRCSTAVSQQDYRDRQPQDVRILVAGATGYIGKYVVKELVSRGYQVTAFARDKSGVGGKSDKSTTQKELAGAEFCFGNVTEQASVDAAFAKPFDVVVSCLASRTGGKKDSWDIDYQATLNLLNAARRNRAAHFVLLSAICVQKPLLEFQHAKLKFEAALQAAGDITYSIVRPTAFFKSLAGQVGIVKKGLPYIMFGDGRSAACKPISEADLATFMAECVSDRSKIDQVLPIGGPGRAWSAREQGEYLFKLLGKQPRLLPVPISIMDGSIAFTDFLVRLFPALEDGAEFSRIGKYYGTESMLVWDSATQKYDADATPSFGKDTLEDFFRRAMLEDGMKGQDLGDAAIF
ncbi:hypothetical protein WJX74_010299 [Apatococcus lobatus]|uniref:Divinyl chlorophyllide a 8-vinyl-reductase, chloroplastic n=1 Tax=Apatococcus lobatus TaxID=904363 RepID=A0AAW1RQ65_9CHLO